VTALYLVDGTFELFRCFHGAPRARVDGAEVGALRGLLWTLVKLLRREDLTHVAVAFDRMAPPAKKDGSPDSLLRSQNRPAAEIVRALGVTLWPMSRGFQADDALATGAAMYGDLVDRTIICTRDKDLLQCVVGERVVVLDRGAGKVSDEAEVVRRFGIRPAQIPAYHALVGDPSDGLGGLPGWGPKSAAAVLARYGTIEDVPDGDWDVPVRGSARLAATLVERRLEAILARNLSRLRTDVPLPHTIADLARRPPDENVLRPLARRIGAEEALERVTF